LYSRSHIDSQKIILWETPYTRHSEEFDSNYFIKILYDLQENSIAIHKPVLSGRPLYYHIDNKSGLYFSTHIKLLRNSGVPITENPEVVTEFLIYRHITAPHTLYKNVYQVGTGDRMQIQFQSDSKPLINTKRYIPPVPETTEHVSTEEVIEKTHALLEDTLNGFDETVSEEMNLLLSGGIDSSILFKICKDKFNTTESFSTEYPESFHFGSLEKSYADSAADALASDHSFYRVSAADYLKGIILSIEAAEEPISHLQTSPFYWLFRKGLPADRHLVISGEAADSNFGTPTHNRLHRGEKLGHSWGKILAKIPGLSIVSKITGKGNGLLKSLNYIEAKYYPLSDLDSLIWSFTEFGSREWIEQHFDCNNHETAKRKYDWIEPFKHRNYYDLLSILYALDYSSNSQMVWSKIGEAYNRILFYPFTSEKLINYVYSIPWKFKLQKQKYILKEVARYLKIPEFIITRPKSGFSLAPCYWFGPDGILEPFIPLVSTVFESDLISQIDTSDDNEVKVLWNMINYAVWKRLHIDGESTRSLIEELHLSSRSINSVN